MIAHSHTRAHCGCESFFGKFVLLPLVVGLLSLLGSVTGCGSGDPGGDIVINKLYPIISAPEDVDYEQINVQTYLTKGIPIKNIGQATLTLNDVALEVGDSAEGNNRFELVDDVNGYEIPAGSSVTVKVKFFAYDEGVVTDKLVINSNDENNPRVEVQLQGAVVRPEIEASPAALNFNKVNIGEDASLPVTIKNVGDGQLSIIDLAFGNDTNSEFSYTLPSSYQLRDEIAPGLAITVTVTYTPVDDVTDDVTFTVTSNDIDHQRVVIPVSGNAFEDTPPVVTIISPGDHDSFYTGSAVLLQALVSDVGDEPEDLDLIWNSTKDGLLCSNQKADESGYVYCSAVLTTVGVHTITLFAVDSRGQSSTDSVAIDVWDEQTELSYVISGSDTTSLYAFTPDDNMQVWVQDGVTGEMALAPCINAMDNIMDPEPPRTCTAKYGDTLIIQGYDRYGPGFGLPALYLWYGNNDEYVQTLNPEPIEYNESMEEYLSIECHPTYTRSEWDEEHPDGPAPDDCLMVELPIVIDIPPPEPTSAAE